MFILTRSTSPLIYSLHGVWQSSYDAFLWEAVKIFRKQSSESPNDYWIAFATGACLATTAICTSARYDPSTNYLYFSTRGNRVVDGPWKLFVSPLDQSQDSQQMVFLTQSSLRQLQERRPHLFTAAWNDSNANKELTDFVSGTNYQQLWGTLSLRKERENEVFRDELLPHGATWITSRLVSLDKAERERDERLKRETSGRFIALYGNIVNMD